ncbi:hypothetical protein B0H11DRAFT_1827998 [Mycena galericulata]|nr:hypothetical protein B0H11DRAFT_1827998 [Mycena galericulata]
MYTEEKLQACIDRISADIDLQKKALKLLELEKSVFQRQLNRHRDPVAKLPLEISSEIFVRCLPSRPEPGATTIPMLFLNVCNSWTDIAVSTPALWTSIHLNFPRVEGFRVVLRAWLQRARQHPLFLSIHGEFDGHVAAIVRQHAPKLQNLEIFHDEDYNVLSEIPGPLSSLETVTFGTSGGASPMLGRGIADISRLAPNLVDCTFVNVTLSDSTCLDAGVVVVLPNLRHLKIGDSNVSAAANRLRYLSLPSLQTLTLSMSFIAGDDLIFFLQQSSPPLQSLILGNGLRFSEMEACLRLVPALTQLEFWDTHGQDMKRWFAGFAEHPPRYVPNLRRLSMPGCWSGHIISDSSWKKLLGALSVHRTQISSLKIALRGSLTPEFKEETLAGFRQLIEDGREIYIGSEVQNFITS